MMEGEVSGGCPGRSAGSHIGKEHYQLRAMVITLGVDRQRKSSMSGACTAEVHQTAGLTTGVILELDYYFLCVKTKRRGISIEVIRKHTRSSVMSRQGCHRHHQDVVTVKKETAGPI